MANNKFQDNAYRQICSEKTLQSNSQGFLKSFADYVAKETGNKWIKNVFGNLKTDEERIKCVCTAKETRDLLENFFINVQEVYRPKNAEFSQKKRLEAESLMKQNDYQGAFMVYCQSVLRAAKTGKEKKIDSGLSLSLALWGRSQALIKLHKFSSALIDIQQALKEHLPESYKAQAFWKQGICYASLGETNKAEVSFGLAEKLMQGDREKIELLKDDKQKIHRQPRDEKSLHGYCEAPLIPEDSCIKLPNASKKLSVKTSGNMGRYIVANQKILTGETLVAESPYAACLLPDMFGTHCHHCFKRLSAPFGCTDCASVAFCTVECRDEAISTYHQYECKYLDLLIGSGMSILGHTALRMVTQNGLKKCMDIYKNRGQERIYELCTNAHLRSAEDFLQRTLMAAFLLRCLQKSNFFKTTENNKVTPSDAEYQVGEMLLFNLQMLQFNAHEIYETRHSTQSRLRNSRTAYIGIAVYLTSSLFNHDCFPALSRHFVGKQIVLTSTRPLEANDPVPENYGLIFTRRNLAERQRSLSSRYWFECQCLSCQQDWPTIGRGLEDVSKRLRCPSERCSQIFTLPVAKDSSKCPKCKNTVTFSNNVLLLKWCEDQYNLAHEMINNDETKNAIDILCVAIDLYYKISMPPNKETHLAEEMLRTCLADSGNTWEILIKN